LIISYKNKLLLLSLGGCFEKKKANKWGIINKEVDSYVLFSYKVLKYTLQFLFIIKKDALLMYLKFDYKLQKSTFITKLISAELPINSRKQF